MKQSEIVNQGESIQSFDRPQREEAEETVDTIRATMLSGSDGKLSSSYKGSIFLRITDDDYDLASGYNSLPSHSANEIVKWIRANKMTKQSEQYYRIDLEQDILIFKFLNTADECIVTGHLIERNPETRIALMEAKRKYLTRKKSLL